MEKYRSINDIIKDLKPLAEQEKEEAAAAPKHVARQAEQKPQSINPVEEKLPSEELKTPVAKEETLLEEKVPIPTAGQQASEPKEIITQSAEEIDTAEKDDPTQQLTITEPVATQEIPDQVKPKKEEKVIVVAKKECPNSKEKVAQPIAKQKTSRSSKKEKTHIDRTASIQPEIARTSKKTPFKELKQDVNVPALTSKQLAVIPAGNVPARREHKITSNEKMAMGLIGLAVVASAFLGVKMFKPDIKPGKNIEIVSSAPTSVKPETQATVASNVEVTEPPAEPIVTTAEPVAEPATPPTTAKSTVRVLEKEKENRSTAKAITVTGKAVEKQAVKPSTPTQSLTALSEPAKMPMTSPLGVKEPAPGIAISTTTKRGDIPVSEKVASLSAEQRFQKAQELYNDGQWYDACDIYRKEMNNKDLNRSRHQEAVVMTAKCYYKLGYKSTADHLLGVVVHEGGPKKKLAKKLLEENSSAQ